MNKLFTVAVLAATILTSPALAQQSHRSQRTAADPDFTIERANGPAGRAYGQSMEKGDYKFCMKTDGSPGCIYNSMEQCMEDRQGRGGFCYSK
jgi:hypothetical protein